MTNHKRSAITSWIVASTKIAAMSVVLSGGLAACAGGDDMEPSEAVAPAFGEDYDQTAPLDVTPSGESGASTNAAPVVGADGSAGDAAVAAMAAEASAADGQAATVPSDHVVASTDTVKAELTDSAPATGDVAAAAQEPTDTTSIFDGSVQPTPPDEVHVASSPGAAQNLPDKRHRRRSAKHSPPPTEAVAATEQAVSLKKGDSSQYVIEPGDTLAKISKKIYGSPARWSELAAINSITDSNRIYAGDVIRYDVRVDKAKEFAKNYNTTMKSVVVKKGDSLSKIAAQTYGSPDAWPRLLSFNREKIKDPNSIPVGLKLEYMDGGKFAALPKIPGPLRSINLRGKSKAAPTH